MTTQRDVYEFSSKAFPMAAVSIAAGDSVGFNTAGYIALVTAAASVVAIGIAAETIDNSGGAAGDYEIAVKLSKPVIAYPLENNGTDACDQTSAGHDVYAGSTATKARKTSNSGAAARLGKCWGFTRDLKVLVEFDVDADSVDVAALIESLASTDNGEGASTVGLEDPAELYAAEDMEALALELKVKATHRVVRGAVPSNVASLAAFTVTGNAYDDGLTYVAGDRVLLANQTTGSQNGIYVVGTVDAGVAPLTRATDMPAGAAYIPGSIVEVQEGTLAGSWKVTATGSKVVGTDDPLYYPRTYKKVVTLAAGTYTIGAGGGGEFLFLKSTTLSDVQVTRDTAGGTIATTVQYVAPVASKVAGKAGTAAVLVRSAIDDGSILNTDTSTVHVLITNW